MTRSVERPDGLPTVSDQERSFYFEMREGSALPKEFKIPFEISAAKLLRNAIRAYLEGKENVYTLRVCDDGQNSFKCSDEEHKNSHLLVLEIRYALIPKEDRSPQDELWTKKLEVVGNNEVETENRLLRWEHVLHSMKPEDIVKTLKFYFEF